MNYLKAKLFYGEFIIDFFIDEENKLLSIPLIDIIDYKYEEEDNVLKVDFQKEKNNNRGHIFISRIKGTNNFVSLLDFKSVTHNSWGQSLGYKLIFSRSTNISSYLISKNACSSLFTLFMNKELNYKLDEEENPWFNGEIQFQAKAENILLNDLFYRDQTIKKSHKFIVLRDPVKRFVSLVNYSRDPTNLVGLPFNKNNIFDENYSEYIEMFLAICRCSKKIKDSYFKDQHYMSQKEHLKGVNLDEINDFVNIEDLNTYLTLKGFNNIQQNYSNEKFIDENDLSKEQILEVKEIFKEDYELIKNIKFWKPIKNS